MVAIMLVGMIFSSAHAATATYTYDNGTSINYTYDAAGNIAIRAATLHGSVNANNAEAVVIFQYGTTTAYGSSVDAEPGLVDGSSDTSVSVSLSDMAPYRGYW